MPHIPHFYESIPGYFTGEDFYRWLALHHPGHGVEVGCFAGRSAAFLAVEMQQYGARLDLVDTFENGGGTPAEVYARLSPVSALIGNIHQGISWESARLYADHSLDFVYIDADHSYEAVSRDIDAWLPKVKIGGVIAGHDFSDYPGFGVIRAVEERFDRYEVWRGNRFEGDGVRDFDNKEGFGRYYPSWCSVVRHVSLESKAVTQ